MAQREEPRDASAAPAPGLLARLLSLVTDEGNGIVGDILRLSLLFGALSLFGELKDVFRLIYRCESPWAAGQGDMEIGSCQRIPQFQSCRRVVVHHSSQLAFALCGPEETVSPSWSYFLAMWDYPRYTERVGSRLYAYDLKAALDLEGDYSGLRLKLSSLGVSQESVDGKVLLSVGSPQDHTTETVFLLEYDTERARVTLSKTLMLHGLGSVERLVPVSKASFYVALCPHYLGWKGKLGSIFRSKEGIAMLCDEFGCATCSSDAGVSGIAVDVEGEKVYLGGRYSAEVSVSLHNIAKNAFEQALAVGLALINQGWDPVASTGFAIGAPTPFPVPFAAEAGLPIRIELFKPKSSGIVNLNSGPPSYTTEVIYQKRHMERFADAYLDLSSRVLFLASPFVGSGGLYMCRI